MCRQEGSVAINMSGSEQHVLGQTGLRDLTLINTKKRLLPNSVFLQGNKMMSSASKFGQSSPASTVCHHSATSPSNRRREHLNQLTLPFYRPRSARLSVSQSLRRSSPLSPSFSLIGSISLSSSNKLCSYQCAFT